MAHMHYTGTGKMHSFRGILGVEEQQRIRIQGSVGAIAWRITKFEVVNYDVGVAHAEHVVKIYREEQSSIVNTVDFSEDELLAAAAFQDAAESTNPSSTTIIFDNALFVRNIWISQDTTIDSGTEKMNYYIELEEVKVSKAGMAQLAVAAARRVYVPGT
jgi:hypothetical protein